MATCYLEVVDGQGRRRQIELDRPRLLIGREPTCDIHLPHPGVSRRHAQLQRTEQGRWLLQDLSSRNHTYVDSRPVQQTVLEARKPFRIADYSLMLQDETVAEAESSAALDDTAPVPAVPHPGARRAPRPRVPAAAGPQPAAARGPALPWPAGHGGRPGAGQPPAQRPAAGAG